MAVFAAQVIGGPCDGDTFKPSVCPRDGDTVVCRGHVYQFNGERMRWVLVGREQKQPN